MTWPVVVLCGLIGAPEGQTPRGEVEQALEEVLLSREYQRFVRKPGEDSWLRRMLEDSFGPAERRESRSSTSTGPGALVLVAQGIVYMAVFTVIALVLLLIIKSVLSRLPGKTPTVAGEDSVPEASLETSHPPGEQASEEYLKRSLSLAAQGDYGSAIREVLLSCMSWLERAGLIRYRRGLTNRDYVRAARRNPGCGQALAVIARNFEEVFFGRRSATAERYEKCLENHRAAFHGREEENSLAG